MSDYRRFVAYLYEYQDDVKGENRGFVKVDSRGSVCQLSIQINAFSLPDKTSATVYGFLRRNTCLQGIYLGELKAQKGVVSGKLLTSPSSMGQSGYSLNSLGGLLIFSGTGKIYGTQWDDTPLIPSMLYKEPVEPETPGLQADSKMQTVPGRIPQQKTPSISSPQPLQDVHIASAEAAAPQPSPIALPLADTYRQRWQKARENHEEFQPFSDEEFTECLRLDLKDLTELRRDNWRITSNQFILYGYYNYQHLLLARLADSEEPAFIFGVPGIYDVKEQFMAGLFGFNSFKPAARQSVPDLRYGYWYRPVS